jgi:hypothetical protein
MTLTARQRTKINAALCLLHDNDHDAKSVIDMANNLVRSGQDPRSAYEAALNSYLANEPAMLPTISMVLRLVDASDDATVDQYDAALSTYATSGDDTELNALAPMIAEDSLALAVRDGEITQEEAANGDLTKALGFEPGPALEQAVAAMGDQPSDQAAPEQQSQQWRQSEQSPVSQLANAPPAQTVTNSSQVSLGGATGVVAPNAAKHWAANTSHPLPNGAIAAPSVQGV